MRDRRSSSTTAATRWACAALALAAAAGAACAPQTPVEEVIDRFSEAVQSHDIDRLFCLSSGAAASAELGADPAARRAGFETWAQAQYEAYDAGRDAGFVTLEPHGIQLVKLFALGRGTFARFEPAATVAPGARTARAELRFGYEAIDLSRFSPGTTIYLSGAPAGTIHAVEIPAGRAEVRLEVLDRITVEWTLMQAAATESCPGGWTVASVLPVHGTEHTLVVRWSF